MSDVEILSGVSAFTGEGFVTIRWGAGVDDVGQLSPLEARGLALHILECADAAELDALVVAELRDGAGLDERVALDFLSRLRARRDAQ